MTKQSFWQKCYKDSNGRVTLYQRPNLPIIVFAISALVRWMAADGSFIYNLADTIAFGSLFTWAWLELFSGSSYFRRLLGFTVLVAIIWHRLS